MGANASHKMGANASHKICRANKNKKAYQYARFIVNSTRACEELQQLRLIDNDSHGCKSHKICRTNKNKKAYQYGRYIVNATRACEEQNRNVARLKKKNEIETNL